MLDALLVVVGPTGVGKSQVAIHLAAKIKAEIISADSRKIYRGMDIGTAKPSYTERRKIPHHLIDIVWPDEVFSAAEFGRRANVIMREIQHKDRLPLLVGGSGLYVRAAVDGIFSGPGANRDLRARLEKIEEEGGSGTLHRELEKIDPLSASRLHSHDTRRVIRALEVYRLSGSPISALQKQTHHSPLAHGVIVGLTMERKTLYEAIDRRVDSMMADSLLEEVRILLSKGYGEDLVSMEGLGYGRIITHLKGECSREEAVRLIKRDTRRFAKHQLTWFKGDPRIIWLHRNGTTTPGETSRKIMEILLKKLPEIRCSMY